MSELGVKDGRFNTKKTSGVSHKLPADHKVTKDRRFNTKRIKGAMPNAKPTTQPRPAKATKARTKRAASK